MPRRFPAVSITQEAPERVPPTSTPEPSADHAVYGKASRSLRTSIATMPSPSATTSPMPLGFDSLRVVVAGALVPAGGVLPEFGPPAVVTLPSARHAILAEALGGAHTANCEKRRLGRLLSSTCAGPPERGR